MKKALIAVTATIANTQDPNHEAAVFVVSELPADHFPYTFTAPIKPITAQMT